MKSFTLRHKLISIVQDIHIRGSRRTAYILARILIPKPKGSLKLKTLYGFGLLIDPVKDKGVERSIYYTGTYEKGTLAVIQEVLKGGHVFVDVGANIGLMSIFVSSIIGKKGKIIAFEPNLKTREILSKNVKINNIKNIEISQFAIGAKKEKGQIYDRWDSNRGSASLVKPNSTAEGHDIEIISLSDYFPENQGVDLIKIDIEGYEFEALKGAVSLIQREVPPMLIVESSNIRIYKSDDDTGQIYDFVKENNYRVFKSSGGKGRLSKLQEVKSKDEMPDHDNIYCFTNNHLKHISNKIFKIYPKV